MMPRRFWALPLAFLAVALVSAPTAAQSFDIAPTYQASVATSFAEVNGARFSAYGLMGGFSKPGTWSPHVWVQRYRIDSDCGLLAPGADDCGAEGWTVSVGPALTFVDTPRWTGQFVGQVGIDSRSRAEWTGGAGIHVGVNFGAFQPQAFSRLDVFRSVGYTMVGVAMKIRVSNGPVPGEPRWAR